MKMKSLALVACAATCMLALPALADTGQTYAVDSNGMPSTSPADAASIGNGPSGAVLAANSSGGYASADLYQYFAIGLPANSSYSLSPGDLLTLPLTITYSSIANISSGPNFAQARTGLDVNSFDGANFSFVQDCEGDSPGGCGSTGTVTIPFNFSFAYLSNGGVLTQAPSIEVHMQAYASGANASAWLDPVIAFDPNGANAKLFAGTTITSAPAPAQTTITSPAPEPASWALMLLGIGGLGIALRRGKSGALAMDAAAA